MSQFFEPVEHIVVWVDGGIHIKTQEPHGDPVEMSLEDAQALADFLTNLVKEEQR